MKKLCLLLSLIFVFITSMGIVGCDVTADDDCSKGHLFNHYVYNDDAGCLKNGTETSVCARGCGATNTRVREGTLLQHKLVVVIYRANTCTQDGVKTHYKCNRCSGLFDEFKLPIANPQSVVIPKAHDLDTAVLYRGEEGHWYQCKICNAKGPVTAHSSAPDAVATQFNGVNCTICGYEIEPALEHEHTVVFKVETFSDCYNHGLEAHYECTTCGAMFLDVNAEFRTFLWELQKPYTHEWQTYESVVIEAKPGTMGVMAKYCKHGCGKYTDERPYLYDDKDYTDNV